MLLTVQGRCQSSLKPKFICKEEFHTNHMCESCGPLQMQRQKYLSGLISRLQFQFLRGNRPMHWRGLERSQCGLPNWHCSHNFDPKASAEICQPPPPGHTIICLYSVSFLERKKIPNILKRTRPQKETESVVAENKKFVDLILLKLPKCWIPIN